MLVRRFTTPCLGLTSKLLYEPFPKTKSPRFRVNKILSLPRQAQNRPCNVGFGLRSSFRPVRRGWRGSLTFCIIRVVAMPGAANFPNTGLFQNQQVDVTFGVQATPPFPSRSWRGCARHRLATNLAACQAINCQAKSFSAARGETVYFRRQPTRFRRDLSVTLDAFLRVCG